MTLSPGSFFGGSTSLHLAPAAVGAILFWGPSHAWQSPQSAVGRPMTLRGVLLWVLTGVAYICTTPLLPYGNFRLCWAIASLFDRPFTTRHDAVAFCLSFGMVFFAAEQELRRL
jgi:hypothetical protein